MVYTEITRRLFGEKLSALEREPQPKFTLGMPTRRMIDLAKRQRAAEAEASHCAKWLKRLHVRATGADIELTYERERALSDQWKHTQRERQAAVAKLRTQAQIDLLDMAPKAAKAYILKLQRQLSKI